MIDEIQKLTDCVERLYRRFKADAPGHWSGDDLGVAKDDWKALSTLPLRDLTRGHIWTFDDLTVAPPIREMRYLLPRWFEIIAQGEMVKNIDIECELTILRRSGYPQGWAAADVALIEVFFAQLLLAVVADPARYQREGAVLRDLSYAELALDAGASTDGILAVLDGLARSAKERVVLNHLMDTVSALSFTHLKGPPAKALSDWIVAQNPVEVLERAFHSAKDDDEQGRMSRRLHWLEEELHDAGAKLH